MWLTKFLIIFSYCVGSYFEQELNSTVFFKNDNYTESSRSSTNNRIVGGKLINIIQVPYQVAFYIDGYFACGGSIISRDWVLTAAHCVYEGGYFAVRVGSRFIGRYGYIRYARTVIYHSKYNAYTLNHDIALVRVDRPFKWTRRIKPILLARPTQILPQKYLVSGWGTTNEFSNKASLALRGVIVEKVPRPRCRAMYQNIGPITKNMICAALPGKDHCRGDSGGPLASNGVQYGVVSFAVGCARRRYPGVYTDVRREYLWIRNAIKKYGGQMPRKMLINDHF